MDNPEKRYVLSESELLELLHSREILRAIYPDGTASWEVEWDLVGEYLTDRDAESLFEMAARELEDFDAADC